MKLRQRRSEGAVAGAESSTFLLGVFALEGQGTLALCRAATVPDSLGLWSVLPGAQDGGTKPAAARRIWGALAWAGLFEIAFGWQQQACAA